jgi:hypothetical protein
MNRRDFLRSTTAASALSLLPRASALSYDLITSVSSEVLVEGRSGKNPSWFHPRACVIPGPKGPCVFMTLQGITGSDAFSPVHWMVSENIGKTWTQPEPVPPLGRLDPVDGTEEGVCDVVPEWHPQSGSVLALGHSVFYRRNQFFKEQPSRKPAYAVWKNGTWGPRKYLEWKDPRGSYIYTNNCGQRVVLPDGRILLAFTFGKDAVSPRSVAGVLCRFDGNSLEVEQVGDEMKGDTGRGLLEPSVTEFQGRYYLTIRAEDNRGYVCAGDNGLQWTPRKAWQWEDGTPLEMSTTQQHWVTHSSALYLAYTRKDSSNAKVMRWRAPLWIAQVDPEKLHLLRGTERVLIPMTGDGVNEPKNVPLMGNFHVTHVTPDETWVTDGEAFVANHWHGNLNLARIRWSVPNNRGQAPQDRPRS